MVRKNVKDMNLVEEYFRGCEFHSPLHKANKVYVHKEGDARASLEDSKSMLNDL
jgi:hypothetical protein